MQKLVFLMAIYAALMPVSAHSATGPYEIHISSTHQSATIGEKIEISVLITNVTNDNVFINHVVGRNQAEFDNAIYVTDSTGHQAPKTRYYRRLSHDTVGLERLPNGLMDAPISSSEVTSTLSRGQSFADGIVLNTLYNLSLPGTYSVQVTRKVPDIYGGGYTESNKLWLTLLPAH